MNNNLKAKVKGTDRVVEVYKLKAGYPTAAHVWNILLGDKLNMAAIQENKHRETFTDDQLEFIN